MNGSEALPTPARLTGRRRHGNDLSGSTRRVQWVTIRAMRRGLLLGAVISACAASPARAPAGVASVLDELHANAAAADEERYFALFAEDAVFLGTDARERWTKAAFRRYAKPHFAKGKAWTFRAVKRAVAFAPDGVTAWFDEELWTERLGPARGSGVLALRDGRWLIVQYNLSITIPNERFPLVRSVLGSERADAPVTDALAGLGWLAGAWQTKRADGTRVEEVWRVPDGASLIGSGRSVRDGKTTFFELLRIEARPDGVFYVAQPMGGVATEFRRVPGPDDALVFENPDHDFPKRVSYRKVPGGVQVRIEGAAGQRVEEWTYTRALLGLDRE